MSVIPHQLAVGIAHYLGMYAFPSSRQFHCRDSGNFFIKKMRGCKTTGFSPWIAPSRRILLSDVFLGYLLFCRRKSMCPTVAYEFNNCGDDGCNDDSDKHYAKMVFDPLDVAKKGANVRTTGTNRARTIVFEPYFL